MTTAGCATLPPSPEQAAAHNCASLYVLPIDLFGRPETGWAIYAPRLGLTLGATASADTPSFAEAAARWRRTHGLGGGGVVDEALLLAVKQQWQQARPFVRLRAAGVCPEPPPDTDLVALAPEDSADNRPMRLRPDALAAYRRMVADARASEPALAQTPDLLRIFSAYRSPERDAARCAAEANCQGTVRAACSAHRTGLAVDLVLEAAPGFAADDTANANRLAMVRGAAYRWLLAQAPRYGFVNYAFEPWHWEWTGAPP